jgi:transcription initiation factor TFIID subunit 12
VPGTAAARSQSPPSTSAGSPQPAAAAAGGPSARPNPPNAPAPSTVQALNSPGRSVVQSIPISASLTVKQPVPALIKQNRPTLTGGNSTQASSLNSPAMVKPPAFEVNGDRILTKRKLSELVSSVVGDEKESMIDGDVEELLMDLADEFVTSVTSFACRLAKHRKSDVLEARDIQLHLERNWNIRIPGYGSDEIRSVRRIAPTQSYIQKVAGVNMSRSVGVGK